jgi:predicted PurR-regulated permease PerM
MSFPTPTPKQARVLWFSLTALAIAILVALLGFLVWGLGHLLDRLSGVLMPVLFALVLAYILDPVVEFFVRKHIPRLWAIVLVMLLCLAFVGALVGSVIPGIIEESRKLVDDLPRNMQVLRGRMDNFMAHSRLGRQLAASWQLAPPPAASALPVSRPGPAAASTNTNSVELTLTLTATSLTNTATGSSTNVAEFSAGTESLKDALAAPFSDTVMPGLAKAVVFVVKWLTTQLTNMTTWLEFLVGFVLVPVYLFYFLLEKKGINQSWPDYLPINESRTKEETVFVLRSINECLIVFFRGQVLVALCVGVLLSAGYLVLGLNYAVLLGLVAAVLGIVPYLGTIVSLTLALTVAGIQFGDWTHPLTVLGIAATVKLLEDLVISPKIMGERSGLHPLTIILAVMIGANLLGGFIGAVLAIPLTAVVRTLMFRYIWKRREHQAPPTVVEPGS